LQSNVLPRRELAGLKPRSAVKNRNFLIDEAQKENCENEKEQNYSAPFSG